MLVELEIHDLGLVESTRLALSPGLNVLTGETGVGKSTVIRALKLLGGSRSLATFVRTGSKSARLRALFRSNGSTLRERVEDVLADQGLPVSEDGSVELERTIARSGSGSVRVNGRKTSVARLRKLTSRLMDIQGQNEHQELLEPLAQRAALDRFAGLAEVVAEYTRDLQLLRARRAELRALEAASEARLREREELQSLVEEIERAEVVEGEFERLRAELKLLDRAHEIRASLGESQAALYESDASAVEILQRWGRRISACEEALPECGDLAARLEAARAEVAEVSFRLLSLIERAEADPARREEVLERIELLRGLLIRYGPFEADVLLRCQEARARLSAMGEDESQLAVLKRELPPWEKKLREQAERIAAARRKSGERLATEIELDLAGLGMAGTRFEVMVESLSADCDLDDPTATSAGRVELRVSANRGEELQPLAAVASGGELARLLLVLRERLADSEGVPVLVFDEIDANVGGRLGGVLGERLQRIAARHQVLCVTHLAQLASYGLTHFKVTKSVVAERTVTSVENLSTRERIGELAEMLAGSPRDELARQQAGQMLCAAAEAAVPPLQDRGDVAPVELLAASTKHRHHAGSTNRVRRDRCE